MTTPERRSTRPTSRSRLAVLVATALAGVLCCGVGGCDQAAKPAPKETDTPQATLEQLFAKMRAQQWDAAAELATAPFAEYLRSVGEAEEAQQQLVAAAQRRFGPDADAPFAGITTPPALPDDGPAIADVAINEERATVKLVGTGDEEEMSGEVELVREDGHWRVVAPDSAKYTKLQIAENERRVAAFHEGTREVEAGEYASAAHAAKWIRGRAVSAAADQQPLVLLDGRAVYQAHVQRVSFLLQLVQAISGPLGSDNMLVWFLLEEECDRAQIATNEESQEQARATLQRPQVANGLQRLAQSYGVTVAEIEQQALEGAALLSRVSRLVEQRAEALANNQDRQRLLQPQVRAKLRVIDVLAESLLEQVPVPSAADVAAHYEQYANTADPHDAGPDRCGYQRPARYILEYVAADPGDFVATRNVTEEAAQGYFQRYREHFRASNGDAQTEEPPTFDAVRDQVFAAARKQQAWEHACTQVYEFREYYIRTTAATAGDEPDARTSLETALAKYRRASTLRREQTKPLTMEELSKLDAIGRTATLDMRRAWLVSVVEALAEGRRASTESEQIARMLGADAPLSEVLEPPVILSREPGPPSSESPAHVYLVRLVRVLPPEAPTLADVQEQIAHDLRLRAAMEPAAELAERLLAEARKNKDLTAAAAKLQQSEPKWAGAIAAPRETQVWRGGLPAGVAEAAFAMVDAGETGEGAIASAVDWQRARYCVFELLGTEGGERTEATEQRAQMLAFRMAFAELTSPEDILERLTLTLPPDP